MASLFIRSILIFGLALMSLSCQKKSEVYQVKDEMHVLLEDAGLNKVMDADWMVGINSKKKVSRGVKVRLQFPILKQKDLENLVEKFNVEAWLIRIKKITPISEREIGIFYLPFIVPGSIKSVSLKIKQVKQVFLNLFYNDAAFAPRYQYFICPAFGHNKIVSDYSTKIDNEELSTIKLSPSYNERLLKEHLRNTVKPLILNGGSTLKGEFYAEIAFYNYTENIKLSNFKRLPKYVTVESEEEVDDLDCKDYKIPESRYEEEKIKQFKFGR